MPRFNINKLRSAGLRYLVADADGQMWAHEAMPIREDGHWRLADEHLCPPNHGDESRQHWNIMMCWRLEGRKFCMPIYDAPVELTFDDEPYDIVEHGLVAGADLKVWPKFCRTAQ